MPDVPFNPSAAQRRRIRNRLRTLARVWERCRRRRLFRDMSRQRDALASVIYSIDPSDFGDLTVVESRIRGFASAP